MPAFSRTISTRGLSKLWALTDDASPNWWKDLLQLWIPNGKEAGEVGLRLAVRSNFLNFYRRGQSVAKVCFDKAGHAYSQTHVQYAFGDKEVGQAYASLKGRTITHPNTGAILPYEGEATLRQWISWTKNRQGDEKEFVDALLGANGNAVDVEMGLPAWGTRETPLRMDLVALEENGTALQIVFWEAKLMSDARIRAKNLQPEILKQMRGYESYLAEDAHREHVIAGYRRTCQLFIELHRMASKLRPMPPLHSFIERAADETQALNVAPRPRLVIADPKGGYLRESWVRHEKALHDNGIPFLLMDTNSTLKLSTTLPA